MAIEFIDNQPWIFQDRNEYQNCKRDDPSCNLIADGDDMFAQFVNNPCGVALLCGSDFVGEGGDLVTNGSFTTDDSGWTVGATWSRDAGGFMHISNPIDATSDLSQTIISGLNQDECYIIVFTVSNYVSGTITPFVGATAGVGVSANGTYRQVIVCGAGGNISFSGTSPCVLDIDSVELYGMGYCWCPDNGNLFHPSIGNNMMCHIPGADTILTQVGVTPPIVAFTRYRVKCTITNRTAGSVRYIVGATAASVSFVGNGTFTDYVLSDGANNFQIVFSSDFDGCITNIIVEEMPRQVASVVDLSGNIVFDLSPYLTYIEGYIVLSINSNTFDFSYGCYKILISDECSIDLSGLNYARNGAFTVNAWWGGTCYFGTWFNAGEAKGTSTGIACGTPLELVQGNMNGLALGEYYIASVRYKSNFLDAGNNIRFDVCGTTVGCCLIPTTSYQTFKSAPFQISDPFSLIRFTFDYGDITAGNAIFLDDVIITKVEPYVSNCFSFQQSHPGTRQIIAIDREDTDPSIRYSFNMIWETTLFYLIQRVSMNFRKPIGKTKRYADRFSTGKYFRSYVEQTKQWELAIERLDETQHDCMDVMWNCKKVSIDGVDYFTLDEEYVPKWDELGYKNVADVKMNVMRRQGVIFADNANR